MSDGSDIARSTSTWPIGLTKSRGSTPATVRVMPLISSDLPTIDESPPNCCCQAACESMATSEVSESASSSRKLRPITGATPSVRKEIGLHPGESDHARAAVALVDARRGLFLEDRCSSRMIAGDRRCPWPRLRSARPFRSFRRGSARTRARGDSARDTAARRAAPISRRRTPPRSRRSRTRG